MGNVCVLINKKKIKSFYLLSLSSLLTFFQFNDLMSRGNFTREDIITVLTANHGNVESAFVELNKTQLKPFLMRIWGPPQGLDNDCGDVSRLRLEGEPLQFEYFKKS